MTERRPEVAGDRAALTEGPVPPLVLAMTGVYMAGVIILRYVHTVHADTPFARMFLSGGRFWIVALFYLILCVLIAAEIDHVLVARRRRRAHLVASAASSSAPPGSSDA
jgi:hypothetical protein